MEVVSEQWGRNLSQSVKTLHRSFRSLRFRNVRAGVLTPSGRGSLSVVRVYDHRSE